VGHKAFERIFEYDKKIGLNGSVELMKNYNGKKVPPSNSKWKLHEPIFIEKTLQPILK